MRGDAGKDAKDGGCLVCGGPKPPSLGVKPRKYCGRACSRIAQGRLPKASVVHCSFCGSTIRQDVGSRGRVRTLCSEECRRKKKSHRKKVEKPCLRCGRMFLASERKVFCGDNCRNPRKAAVLECQWCGREFNRLAAGVGRNAKNCSTECAKNSMRAAGRKRARTRQCLCCLKPFFKRATNRNSGKYCSRECAFEARRLRLPAARLTKRAGATLDVQLAIWFSSWGSDADRPINAGETSTSYKSRCARYGCHYEPFPKRSILNRDGWVCQMCRCKLLPRFTTLLGSNTPHPRSPTIDHIVPLAFGPSGPGHRPDNVQASCWSCNVSKSDSFDPALATLRYS